MPQLAMDQLDLLLRMGNLLRLERLQVTNIFSLEVFECGFMVWVEAVLERRELVIGRHRVTERLLMMLHVPLHATTVLQTSQVPLFASKGKLSFIFG